MTSVSLKAYAKINLGLKVLGRRADGFHELRTIYQSISLADHLEVSLSSRRHEVRLVTSGPVPVPQGRENLAVRSAEVVLDSLHVKRGVSIRLQKNIPAGSGLGGASSDASAVIRAILALAKQKLSRECVLALAAHLGSDVPFFLVGGTALGVGRGEEVYSMPELPRRYCVVVFTGTSVSTAAAYQQLGLPPLTRPGVDHTIELFCARANEGSWSEIGNDFERVVFQTLPVLSSIKKRLLRSGAEMASLSGSGSAVFGLFLDRRQALASAEQLRRPGHHVFVARTVSRREFGLTRF